MSFNILDAAKKFITPDLIAKASSFLGESNSSVVKALSAILPSVAGGIISKSNSGHTEAKEIFHLAKESHNSGLTNNLGNMFSDGGGLLNQGLGFLKSIFGYKSDIVAENISQYADIKKSSASTLLSLAAPTVLSAIGNHANEKGLSSGDLTDLLSSQKSSIMNLLPTGLSSLASMIGLDKISEVNTSKARTDLSAVRNYNEREVKKGSPLKWLLPLLLIAGAVLAISYLTCNRKGSSSETGTLTDTTTIHTPAITTDGGNTTVSLPSLSIDTISNIISYDLGKDISFSLPNGTTFTAAESGFESQLLNFINTGTIDTVNKSANWFNMFDVQFKTGGNLYTGKAEAQLKNCAAILKAYPAVKIKLGGYTDNTGAADANKKISQQRADKVKADLIKMGAAANQIEESVGYGQEFPVCEANDTPECRARNRRVGCKVAVK